VGHEKPSTVREKIFPHYYKRHFHAQEKKNEKKKKMMSFEAEKKFKKNDEFRGRGNDLGIPIPRQRTPGLRWRIPNPLCSQRAHHCKV